MQLGKSLRWVAIWAYLWAVKLAAISLGINGFAQDMAHRYQSGAHPLNEWVKRSPLPGWPPSPRLGYEGACVWDSKHHVMIRYGGHNQGGGGEQGSEIWTFDPVTAVWKLHEPNTSPPGICCGQQNVFDPVRGRYLRFPAFSAGHGWQWRREVWLNDASVWSYDLETNTWRNLRPYPTAHPRPLRCAAWDVHHQVVVLFGGEGSSEGTLVYDPYTNSWTPMNPGPQPDFRSGGNMVYDPYRRLFVLFGSQFTDDPHTWLYDLRTNRWRDAAPKEMPPTDRNDAVLTYDLHARRVLAIVKVGGDEEQAGRLETWTYDVEANQWRKIQPVREPDYSGNRARQLHFAPEWNVAVLENRTHPPTGPAEQQVWTFRLVESDEEPDELPPPSSVQVTTTDNSVRLSWRLDSVPVAGRAGFRVFRAQADVPWKAELSPIADVPDGQLAYEDSDVKKGALYFYAVATRDAAGQVGPLSRIVRAQTRVVEDVIVSVNSTTEVHVEWTPPDEADDVIGYLVERAPVEVWSDDQLVALKKRTPPLAMLAVGGIRRVGQFQAITPEPVTQPRFEDRSVDLTKPSLVNGVPSDEVRWHDDHLNRSGRPYPYGVYAYRVRVVNRLGVPSGPSPAVFTIPSAPQWVFSRESDGACQIRWKPNPESGVVGYRVYRMDGRFDDAPIRRLTSEPIQEPTFVDPDAGSVTRRYYVVAVDRLGQEGHPSSPVWYLREWRSFYQPFVGEWHQ